MLIPPVNESESLIPPVGNEVVQSSPKMQQENALHLALADVALTSGNVEDLGERTAFQQAQVSQGKYNDSRERLANLRYSKDRTARALLLEEQLAAPTLPQDELLVLATQDPVPDFSPEEESVGFLQNIRTRYSPEDAALIEEMFQQETRDQGSILDITRDRLAKAQMFKRLIDEYDQRSDEQSLAGQFWDFLGRSLLFKQTLVDKAVTSQAPEGFDFGESFFKVNQAIFEEMTPSEAEEFLRNVVIPEINDRVSFFSDNADNPAAVRDVLTKLLNIKSDKILAHNVLTGVDIAFSLGDVGGMAALQQIVRYPLNLVKASAGRKLAGEVAATELRREGAEAIVPGLTKTDIMEEALPSSHKMSTGVEDIPLSAEVQRNLDRETKLLDKFKQIVSETGVDVLDPAERQKLARQTELELNREFLKNPVFDVEITRTLDGSYDTTFSLGKNSGGGYASERGIREAMKRYGIGTYETFQDSSGQWFAKATRNADFSTALNPWNPEKLGGDGIFGLSKKLLGNSAILEDYTRMLGLRSQGLEQRLINEVLADGTKFFRSLGNKARKRVQDVFMEGHKQERWFSRSELKSKGLSGAEIEGYFDLKTVSEIDYQARNLTEMFTLKSDGFQKISFATADGELESFAKVINTESIPAKERVFNLTDKKFYGVDELSPTALAQFREKGYRLHRLKNAVEFNGTDPTTLVLAKPTDVTMSAILPTDDLIGYVAGGHRTYAGKNFIKQSRTGKFSDGGTYVKDPSTHFVIKSRAAAKEVVEELERGRIALRDFQANKLSRADAERILETTRFESVENGLRFVDEGVIQLDTPFEVVFDGDSPVFTRKALDAGAVNVTTDSTDIQKWYNTRNKGLNSKRGAHLLDENEQLAELLDPVESVNKAARNILNTGAYLPFRRSTMERWAKTAKQLGILDPNSVRPDSTIEEIFNYSRYRKVEKPLDKTLIDKMEAQRLAIQRSLNMLTPTAKAWDDSLRTFAERFATPGKNDKGLANRASQLADLVRSKNPVNFFRGMAFDLKLGYFNVWQIPLQVQTAVAVTAMDPTNGFPSFAAAVPTLFAIRNGSDEAIAAVAKNMKWAHGLEIQEYKDMVNQLRKSGFLHVGSSNIDTSVNSSTLASNFITEGLKSTAEAGRIPFNTAEEINKATAWGLAWRRWRKANPKGDPLSKDAMSEMVGMADDFSLNMTAQGAAYWNTHPLTSLPTQFRAYHARMIETLLGAGTKGGRLSKSDRARFALGQIVLYGSSSVPYGRAMKDYFAEQYYNATGEEWNPVLDKALEAGLIDTAINLVSGGEANTDFSQRVAFGPVIEDLFEPMFNNEISELATLLGPSPTILYDTVTSTIGAGINAYRNLVVPNRELSVTDIGAEAVNETMRNFSSYNKALQVYEAFSLGRYISRKGQTITDVNKSEAWALLLLDATPADVGKTFEIFKDNKSRQEYVRQKANDLLELQTKSFKAYSQNDMKMYEYYNNAINHVITRLQDDDPRLHEQVLQQFMRNQGGDELFLKALDRNRELFGDTPTNLPERTE